ncbi:MAG: penicillin-binding protein [Micromonosporaceae bacterium]|nr:penicillin-binding protein [Micromonosporaceae bacterium]
MAKDKGTTGGSDSGAERPGLTTTGEGLFHRIRTGEWPALKIDLSEAYANVRRRAATLRRRRIISGILVGIVLAGLAVVATTYYANAIPLPGQLALPATTTVYYSDGTTVMARLGTQRRTIVSVDRLPRYVGQAVIAAEDPQYYTTSGTLISRQYARASTIATGGSVAGAAGQARLMVMTWRLEDTYSKEEILGFYLNTVYFGRGAYGIEEAARTYFGVGAERLTLPQAILLAGMIESPGDGRFDPTVNVVSATTKFATVAQTMVSLGMIDQETASRLTMPTVLPYDPSRFASGLSEPTGLIVAQVLAELRATDEFRDRPPGYLEDGGYSIITTIDANVQRLLLRTVDENERGSLLSSGPRSLAAAAVVVEPGTGRVLAYYGGPNGTGADYAGTRLTPDGGVAGFGYHPPAQTMTVYTLAAALDAGISAASRWDAPSVKEFPASGRTAADAVRDVRSAPCQPACTLAEAATVPLSIPFYAVTERIGPEAVIEMAHAAGIGAMWSAGPDAALVRHELAARRIDALVPEPFTTDVALGSYPVTVLDQATAMATFAAGGLRAETHFVARVVRDYATVYEAPSERRRVVDADVVADVTAVLAQNSAGQIPDGPPTAGVAGTALLAGSAIDAVHAWYVGYAPDLAMAVWVGNKEYEFPLRSATGDRITGETLPAQIFRTVIAGATDALGLGASTFPAPANIGDDTAGDAP